MRLRVALTGLLLATVHSAHAADSAPNRPNLLLVFLDDQRYDAMSCAGHPFAQTPNMDRLAREGAYCQNAFVTISLCSPSRACYLTGQYAHSHGVIRNNNKDLRAAESTWPKLLQKAGYQTGYFGKLHGAPTDEKRPGFDYWVSYKGQGVYFNCLINVNGEHAKNTGYIDDFVTDRTIEWLTKKRDKSKPFGITLAFKATHGQWEYPDRYNNLYADVSIPRPATWDEPLDNKPAFVRTFVEKEASRHEPMKYDLFIRKYNRTIRSADDNLGRVLKALEGDGTLDNTFIVFSSDNGYYQGEHHGMFDKRSAYEESMRIPMLVRYPKLIKAGVKVPQMVTHIDVAPTFLELAGVPIPSSIQGRSMLPVLTGHADDWRRSFFYEYFRERGYPSTPTIQAVRTDRHKYITYLDPADKPELYDLQNDPHELKNLRDVQDQQKVLKDLEAELERLKNETGAGTPSAME